MSTSTVAAPTGTWQLDKVHSSVAFQVPYLAGAFNGSFREFDGTLDLSDDGAALTGTAQVASVDVKDDNLSAHLQSPDFFDAEGHPELSFASDRDRARRRERPRVRRDRDQGRHARDRGDRRRPRAGGEPRRATTACGCS